MTREEKKVWLSRYRSILREIRAFTGEYEELNTIEHRIWDPEAAHRISEISQIVKSKVDELVIARKDIESAVASISEPKLKEVISYRYILDYTFFDIADIMHLDLRWIHRLHVKALDKIECNSAGGERYEVG